MCSSIIAKSQVKGPGLEIIKHLEKHKANQGVYPILLHKKRKVVPLGATFLFEYFLNVTSQM